MPSGTLFTFGFLEQLFCELDHLDHLDPWEAFAHSKDDTVIEGVQQDAPAGIPQLIKLFPVQEPPQVLPPLGFLQGEGDKLIPGHGTDVGSHVQPENSQACEHTQEESGFGFLDSCASPFPGTCSFGCTPMCVGTHVWVCSCVCRGCV